MDKKTQIIAVAGKGGVGKTSLAGVIVKLLLRHILTRRYLRLTLTLRSDFLQCLMLRLIRL